MFYTIVKLKQFHVEVEISQEICFQITQYSLHSLIDVFRSFL